jgi:hypothetical protein
MIAAARTASLTQDDMLAEVDRLILAVIKVLEGDEETEIVRRMLRLRDALSRQPAGTSLTEEAEAARDELLQVVNNFFYDKLTALPEIQSYLDDIRAAKQ